MSCLLKLLLPFFFVCISFSSSYGHGFSLFDFKDKLETEWAAKTAADIQRVAISIDRDVLYKLKYGEISEFQMSDLSGNTYTIVVQRIIEQLDGDWSLTGHIEGNWNDAFILSFSGGEVLSSFRRVSTQHYLEIKYIPIEAEHYLVQVDPHKRDELECGNEETLFTPDVNKKEMGFQMQEIQASDVGAVITVMVVYTPAAESWANSNGEGIRNVINSAMAIAQNSADNSLLDLEFRLVHTARVDYTESGSTDYDLQNLTNGLISNVRALRNQFGADLVAMFTFTQDVGGMAWIANNEFGNASRGYSITRVQQAGWTSTHAHEMGHNLGSHHSRNQQINAAPPSGGVFEHSTGWRWTGKDGRSYASVMTYPEGSLSVNVFSNPNVFIEGTPTGSYSGIGAPADNARSIRFMKHVIASYRSPEIPVAMSAADRSLQEFTAAWQPVPWASHYEVDVAMDPDFQRMVPGYQALEVTGSFSLTVEPLEPGTEYFYRVRSIVGSRTSSSSNVIHAKTLLISDQNSIIETQQLRILANGIQNNPVRVVVKSNEGTPLRNLKVRLVPESGQPDVEKIEPVTNNNGEAFFALSSLTVETVAFQVLANGTQIGRFQVEFLASEGALVLENNYPNPFRDVTKLPFNVPREMKIRIVIYDALGRPVLTAVNEIMDIGYYEIPLELHGVASGLYFSRLYSDDDILIESMTLIR